MTTFEEQLVNAIKHGCPKCGSKALNLYSLEEREYPLSLYNETLDYGLSEFVSGTSTNTAVLCDDCVAELWTRENGWIPELQPIVEKEGDGQ